MPLLQHDGELMMTESGAMAAVHYQSGLAPGRRNQFATEVALALAVTLARRFVGEKVCPQGILLPYGAPEHRAAYDEVFRCPIVFKSHTTALIFDRALLEVEYPFADTFLREVFENELARVLVRAGRNVPLHFRLRAILERQHNTLDRQKLPDVSRMLGLSRRAIRRHLAAEGHSFSRILQSLRRDQAMRLLENVGMPIKDIAEAMGYSDPSAFHRAFRRWTGVTPRQFRLNLGEPARSDAA
jgi:AraC-like DNA-binding protein